MASRPLTRSVRPFADSRRQTVLADAVGPRLAALREDTYQRPITASARMARAGVDLVIADAIEVEHDFDMRKVSEARRRVFAQLGRIERNRRLDIVPVIVGRFDTSADHGGDGTKGDDVGHSDLRCWSLCRRISQCRTVVLRNEFYAGI